MASAGSQSSSPVLTISPKTIDLGEVAAGGCKGAIFSLTNPGDVPVALTQLETSCHCLQIELPKHLAPGETVTGHARLDLRAEPNFTGGLGIEVKGADGLGAVLFVLRVNVVVRRN